MMGKRNPPRPLELIGLIDQYCRVVARTVTRHKLHCHEMLRTCGRCRRECPYRGDPSFLDPLAPPEAGSSLQREPSLCTSQFNAWFWEQPGMTFDSPSDGLDVFP